MIRLLSASLSESVIIDQMTNQISIFNLVESIQIPGPLPISVPRLVFTALWTRDDRTGDIGQQIRLILRSPSGATNTIGEFDVAIEADKQRTRNIINLIGLEIQEAGLNHLVIERKNGSHWIEVGSVQLEIINA